MTVLKRKKSSRMRGSHTHGTGGKKKARGAGNKGGRGNAGSGKRADAKRPSFWTIKNFEGKHGFKRKPSLRVNYCTINLNEIESMLPTFLAEGVAKKEGNSYSLDLSKTKYTKLLGKGNISFAININVDSASQKAIEKIKIAKGSVKTIETKVSAKNSDSQKDSSDEDLD
ncbi:MAG TPA: uL15 family ribosomal protein [Candidatus Woesearchaeota archaeon]|nr:uL15 family ribosomal protein [Candidatus Woesearchaeota archaeon]